MSALEHLGDAVGRALDECSVEDVLSVLTGAFVGLVVEVVRRKGHDSTKQITLDGGSSRDITIGPLKEPK